MKRKKNFNFKISVNLNIFPATGFIARKCAENKAAAALLCQAGGHASAACEVCDSGDGCNGAAQYGPLAMMIAIPAIVIIKMLAI